MQKRVKERGYLIAKECSIAKKVPLQLSKIRWYQCVSACSALQTNSHSVASANGSSSQLAAQYIKITQRSSISCSAYVIGHSTS